MLESIVAWVSRQYGTRKTRDECIAIASAMLDTYYSDSEYYGATSLWRLHDASNASANL